MKGFFMPIKFAGTHFLDDHLLRKTTQSSTGKQTRYDKESGARDLCNKYLDPINPVADWQVVGRFDNVWILDSGSGITPLDQEFSQDLQAFAHRNSLQQDQFHKFSDQTFLVPRVYTDQPQENALSMDQAADLIKQLHKPEHSRGLTGYGYIIYDAVCRKLGLENPFAR
jgi:hypothetical protein